jgi:hypothetical protein
MNSLQFIADYPVWLWLVCLLAGALYSWILYRKDELTSADSGNRHHWKWLMAAFRFLAVSLIAFLLINPYVRSTVNRIEKPIVALLQDQSASAGQFTSAQDSAGYTAAINEMLKQLEEKFEVRAFSFSEEMDELNFQFTGASTNIGRALNEVNDRFTNQNLGAVIVASDGLYNSGSNPAYSLPNIPVYSIAMGDSTRRKDIRINRVLVNRKVYLNDYFTMQVEWLAQLAASEAVQVSLYRREAEQKLFMESKSFSVEGNAASGTVEFVLRAAKPGILHYRIELSPVAGETSTANNVRDVFVEVAEKKQKIFLLANSPHPDVAAIVQSATALGNYEVEVGYGADVPASFSEYSVFILHQVPSGTSNPDQWIQQLKKAAKPVWFIAGAQTNAGVFSSVQNSVRITNANGSVNQALPVLNSEFSLFQLTEESKKLLQSVPPLQALFGEYRLLPLASAALTQKIGSVYTSLPLLALSEGSDGRIAVLCGEGLWKWRLHDFRLNSNHRAFQQLISSILQFLAVDENKNPFVVRLQKDYGEETGRVFGENEQVNFTAELRNESNQLVNDVDASLLIRNEAGNVFPFQFSKTGSQYSLNAGYLPAGSYTYTGAVNRNGKQFTSSGAFTVELVELEQLTKQADHQLLYLLSSKSGGQMFYPSQIAEAADSILALTSLKPVMYSSTRTQPFISWQWLLIPIILLLAAEWGIRKFLGGY